jgi:pilus assembly protein CpaB
MTRRIIAVIAAVVLAAIGTGAVLLYLRTADARALAGKEAKVVLVAEKVIPAGTKADALLAKGYVREERMPAESLPEDALGEVPADLAALVTTGAVPRGWLLMRSMFGTAASTGSGLAIPDGMLAVTARVRSNVFSPEALSAGSKVAIFYTYTPVSNNSRDDISSGGLDRARGVNSVTRVLLTDVEVISVGPAPGSDGGNDNQRAAANDDGDFSVTFGLTQRDAEKLAHVVTLGGQLNVGLLGDSSNVKPDNGVDNGSIFG